MTTDQIIKKSKWLSKHLRHQPERIGITLEEGGWIEVEILLKAAHRYSMMITREQLDEIVLKNDKQRFSFDESGLKIRANQGHSVEVDLQLDPQTPPDVLLHGTGKQNHDSILRDGLVKGRRHHVHLSRDLETATKVGARHGKPLVFNINAQKMSADGYIFYCSENGVWLTDEVPPQYLSINE
jgi:putative RNA 2'-phosphotransferase